jgi:hypothetical protein
MREPRNVSRCERRKLRSWVKGQLRSRLTVRRGHGRAEAEAQQMDSSSVTSAVDAPLCYSSPSVRRHQEWTNQILATVSGVSVVSGLALGSYHMANSSFNASQSHLYKALYCCPARC